MVAMPIINKGRIMNIRIGLKDVDKVNRKVNYRNIQPSDIIGATNTFMNSSFNTKYQEASDVTEFIRIANIHNSTDVLISTKFYRDFSAYDLYQVSPISLKKVTTGLDNLYGSLILDLKNEIPDSSKGKNIDLEKLGVTKHITDEKLDLLQTIASDIKDGNVTHLQKALNENGLGDLIETLEFIKLFHCEVIPKTSVSIDIFLKVLNCVNAVNSKEARELNNFYRMAVNNMHAYSRLSRLHNIVYGDSFDWIHTNKDKTMVKKADEVLRSLSDE